MKTTLMKAKNFFRNKGLQVKQSDIDRLTIWKSVAYF